MIVDRFLGENVPFFSLISYTRLQGRRGMDPSFQRTCNGYDNTPARVRISVLASKKGMFEADNGENDQEIDLIFYRSFNQIDK